MTGAAEGLSAVLPVGLGFVCDAAQLLPFFPCREWSRDGRNDIYIYCISLCDLLLYEKFDRY